MLDRTRLAHCYVVTDDAPPAPLQPGDEIIVSTAPPTSPDSIVVVESDAGPMPALNHEADPECVTGTATEYRRSVP